MFVNKKFANTKEKGKKISENGVVMNNKTKVTLALSALLVVILATIGALLYNGKSTAGKVNGDSTSISSSTSSQSASETSSSSSSATEPAATSTTQASESTKQEQKPQSNGLQLSPSIEEVKVKAVYLTGPSAGLSARVDNIINIANKTELNTVVVDIKEDGTVNYASNVEMVQKFGKQMKYYKPEALIKKFHENGIYVIGRIVVFKDPVLSKNRADLAIKKPDGTLWKENGTTPWANPYNEEVWDYNIQIAKEAISKGFDEIQFDYVRFPTGKASDFNFGQNVPVKSEAINGFLAKSQQELHDKLGVPVSADVFAIITESKTDGERIGQIIEEVGKDIYCISPMIYPSHYANDAKKGVMANGVGQKINGVMFTKPDLDPYGVVNNALLSTKTKISVVSDYKAKVRPYIQAFTAKYLPAGYFQTYGAEEIKAQMKAVYDAGYEEWILWDPSNKYQESYFEAEK